MGLDSYRVNWVSSIAMNDTTLLQLKILVERAVRFVRASQTRKHRMREELLGHISAVFDEELARFGTETAALERTAARFGSPNALTTDLQASVPRNDVLLSRWERLLFRPGEAAFRRASRLSLLALAVVGTALLIVFISQHRLQEWPMIPAVPTFVFSTSLLLHWMREALCRPNSPRWSFVILISVAAWLLVPTMAGVLCFVISGDARSSLLAFREMLLPGTLLPLTVIAAAPPIYRQIRQVEEWAELDIDQIS
jgi:hypothetical protein